MAGATVVLVLLWIIRGNEHDLQIIIKYSRCIRYEPSEFIHPFIPPFMNLSFHLLSKDILSTQCRLETALVSENALTNEIDSYFICVYNQGCTHPECTHGQRSAVDIIALYLIFWDGDSHWTRSWQFRLNGWPASPQYLSISGSPVLRLQACFGDLTHILMLAWQALGQLSHPPSPQTPIFCAYVITVWQKRERNSQEK